MNIAINGFGRIGKTFLRTILQDEDALKKLNVAIINIGPQEDSELGLLFKHDSLMGTLPNKISYENKILSIDNLKIKIIAESNPKDIDWKKYNIDWVVESSGHFTSKESAMKHIESGAKKVLITAPGKDEDITIIPGVNDEKYDPKIHKIIALGSCTTNCFAPIVKVLKDNFSLQYGLMTTVHAYTNDQVLLDIEHKDPRRARAAAINIIPTKTGASQVITKIYPDLEGKLFASAMRVPIAKVSIVDFTFETTQTITKEEINKAFKIASETKLKNILEYCDKPLVSSDFNNNPSSCIIDSLLTLAARNMGKVFGWYDNEWGYSMRLRDFLLHNY